MERDLSFENKGSSMDDSQRTFSTGTGFGIHAVASLCTDKMDNSMPNPSKSNPNRSSRPSCLRIALDISMLSNLRVLQKEDDQILYSEFTFVIIYAASSSCEINWASFILVQLPCRRCYVHAKHLRQVSG